jgi:secretion/DNA translocation related TadE-like protein
MMLVVAAAGVAISYGAATVDRHRAGAAADAAALAVALRAVDGSAAACLAGTTVARLDGARITRCTLQGPVADIVVAVRLPGVLSRFGSATGHARAGPASESPP